MNGRIRNYFLPKNEGFSLSKENRSFFKEVSAILTVLGGAVLLACLFAWWGVRALDAPRVYKAGDLFPSPQTAFQLAYAQKTAQGARARQYRFDRIMFYPASKPVNRSAYTAFYALIAQDKSIKEPASFDGLDAFQLVIYTKELEEAQTSVFVEMQIASKGDLYRILLRDQGPEKHWIYFSHPDISRQSVEILAEADERIK